VAGTKGSRLQLVLNTVYHLDRPLGNIPFALYEKYRTDRRVKLAIPVAVGDFYEGHRLVGASDAFVTRFEPQPGRPFQLGEGRVFKYDEATLAKVMAGGTAEPGAFEAVAGSAVPLRVGATFAARHGGDFGDPHQEKWTVVGVLKPTGTANDRAIFINLDSFFHIKGHQGEELTRGKITAVLFKTKGTGAAEDLAWEINNGPDAQAVVPAQVVVELFDLIGQVDVLLLAVSVLVILVAGVSILVSIYNSMAERKRAIAIMRALGARRTSVLAIVILEAAALCLFGGLAGLLLGHVLTAVSSGVLAAKSGVSISALAFHPVEALVFAGVVVLGALAGVLPALKAYRTDIADGLSPTS
jgi:putative ABC transport system permease protein